MKKLGLMFMAGVLAFGFSSCESDDDAPKPTPKFDFITDVGYTSANATVTAGTTVTIGIDATGSENLESVGVRTQVGTAQEAIYPLTATGDSSITSLKTKNVMMEFEYTTGQLATNERITVIVKMSNGTQTSKSIVLTVTAAAKTLLTADARQMGAQNNSDYGSYFSMESNSAEKQADANANPAAIDWIYYYGTSNLATLAAPNDPQVAGVMNNNALSTWPVKNATTFKKVSLDFDATTTNLEVAAEIAKGGFGTMANQLQMGDVVVFVTAGAKEYGIFKIISIAPASGSGVITFDMKFIAD